MRVLILLALALASAQTIAAQAPGPLPSLMLPLPQGSETSVASALMLPKDVAVVRVASSTGEHRTRGRHLEDHIGQSHQITPG
jgi:hypothetical protein